MLDPAAAAFFVGAGDEGGVGRPVSRCRCPHRLRLGADDPDRAVALKLAAVAAVDQPPIVPGLGNEGLQRIHAATAAGMPMVARAQGPEIMLAPAAQTSSSLTAISDSMTSAGSTRRPCTDNCRAT